MHPRVLASRNGAADDRITRAARALAEQHDLDPALVAGLQVYERDPETRAVMRREAVADLLEALVQPGGGEVQPAEAEAETAAPTPAQTTRRGPGRPRKR